MSRLTSAVNIVTTAGASGRYGFTASSVCSVTDAPPTLLVCMNRASYLHEQFLKNRTLAVNVLAAHHQLISEAFSSKMTSETRFSQGEWATLKTGAPILQDALVNFDCRIEHIQEVGTHSVFICRIIAIQKTQQDQGLIYFRRIYHSVGRLSDHLPQTNLTQ
jgi:flavin reductase